MENNELDVNYYDSLVDQLKDFDTSDMSDKVDQGTTNSIIENQRTYLWIRLYLKDEVSDLKIGDMFEMSYEGECLSCQFIAFGKNNSNIDYNNLINYDPEDDKNQLCLMFDQDVLTSEIPFLRSLFRSTPYFQYQVYRRDDLKFVNKRTNDSYVYMDARF